VPGLQSLSTLRADDSGRDGATGWQDEPR
jgi:hypothetical protein